MTRRLLVGVISLLLSACSFQSQDDSVKGQFNPPLVYKNWQSSQYTTKTGLSVCAISSGNNGLTVTLGQVASGIDEVVASNRTMQPGAILTVTVGDRNFETSDSYFSPESGRSLVEYLMKNDRAYLDWSEINGPAGGQRIHIQNILRLDDFHAQVKQCRETLVK